MRWRSTSSPVRIATGSVALSISLAGAIGWLTGQLSLTRVNDNWVTMKFPTAVLCLLACAMVFGFHLKGQRYHVFASIMASAILFFAGFIVADIRADGWSVPLSTIGSRHDSLVLTTEPGLPSLGTMVAFTLIGGAGVFFALGAVLLSRAASAIATCMGMFALLGYVLNRPWMYYYQPDESTAMAVTTASVVFLNSALLLYLKPPPSEPSSSTASSPSS